MHCLDSSRLPTTPVCVWGSPCGDWSAAINPLTSTIPQSTQWVGGAYQAWRREQAGLEEACPACPWGASLACPWVAFPALPRGRAGHEVPCPQAQQHP